LDGTVSPGHAADRQAGLRSRSWASTSQGRKEILLALAVFALLCVVALSFAPFLAEPDDYAYQASIIAMTQGHFLTLPTAQVHALAAYLGDPGGSPPQWVQLSDGRWISQKDPGYPFLAAPFQALGIIRLAPLFYGALGCLGLFFGARRWLGPYGGAAAIALYCSSGVALLFAWRDYMPTFTDASLIAAGTGALLWAVLAAEATARRRICVGLAGFVALEAAVFTRYTDIVVLGCAVVAATVAWRLLAVKLPAGALGWWLGSAAVFGAGVAVFNDLVYGSPLKSGYPPGLVTFSLDAVLPNLRDMPAHLIEAIPMLLLGLAGLVWIIGRSVRLRRSGGGPAAVARRDVAVGLALAASWFSVWALYAAYTWTPGGTTLQTTRFYVPAIGAISLLGAWLLVHLPGRVPYASLTSAAVVVALFGLGTWSFNVMRESRLPGNAQHTARRLTTAQQKKILSQGRQAAACMHAHGIVSFPNPTAQDIQPGLGAVVFPLAGTGLDPNSRALQSAMNVCNVMRVTP
jgi:hypothetical protein